MANANLEAGFDRFRKPRKRPPSRTPEAAILGLLEGEAEAEDLFEAVGRVRPLVSVPQDPADLDRALSRWSPGRGETALGAAFRGLLASDDQETALHAAESLSVMEVRYARDIEKARSANDRSGRAALYAEMADLAGKSGALRSFYLQESFNALRELSAEKKLGKKDILLAARIHSGLGKPRAAMKLIEKALGAYRYDAALLEALADLAFRVRDYAALQAAVTKLRDTGSLGMGALSAAARRWL